MSCGQETHPPALFFLARILSVPRSPLRTRLFPFTPACPSHPGGSLVRGGRKNGFNHGLPTVRREGLSPALIANAASGAGPGNRTLAAQRCHTYARPRPARGGFSPPCVFPLSSLYAPLLEARYSRSTSHRGLEGFVQDLLKPNRILATYGMCRRRFRLAGIHGGLAKGAGLEPTQACALLAIFKTAALPLGLPLRIKARPPGVCTTEESGIVRISAAMPCDASRKESAPRNHRSPFRKERNTHGQIIPRE